VLLFILIVLATVLSAQDSAKTQSSPKKERAHPSRSHRSVQVVFTELTATRKFPSLPYTLSVNADVRRANPTAQVRSGVAFHPVDKDKVTTLMSAPT